MTELASPQWCAAAVGAASHMVAIPDLSFGFKFEVPDAPAGKVRGFGRIDNGVLVELELGKAGFDPQVSFEVKAKRLVGLVTGDLDPLVAYMRGELKVDGAYELVVDRFANSADRAGLAAMRSALAEQTLGGA